MDNPDTQINTGGGAYVGGDVDTGGGNFVGRDQHVHGDLIVGDGERVRLPTDDDVRAYLLAVQQAYSRWADRPEQRQPLWNPAMVEPDERPDAFIALKALRELPMRVARFVDQPGAQVSPSQDLLAALANQRRAVILGDPGSGKSTALERIAWATATAGLAMPSDQPVVVPILARLIDYAGEQDLIPLLVDALQRHGLALANDASARQWFQSSVAQFVMLLDGLNELEQEHRKNGVSAIRRHPRAHPQHQMRLTCRTADFDTAAQDDATTRIPADGLPWVIQELIDAAEYWDDDDHPSDVRDYLRSHLGDAVGKRLWDRLHRDERLSKLARNPLFLWMIMETGADGGILPPDRGRLVQSFVQRGKVWRRVDHELRGLAERCLEALGDHMQAQGVLQIDDASLLEVFEGVRGKRSETPDAIRRALLSTGLIVRLPRDRYEFRHQLIQEYAAAARLTSQSDCGLRLAERARDEWWRETAIMTLWLRADLHTPAYLQGLMGEPAVDLRVRIAAATILAQVGDPRFVRQPYQVRARSGGPATRTVLAIEPAMVAIPAGLALLGGEDPDADSGELPQSRVPVAAFELAGFPVTNAEFACFMEDKGYEQLDLWTPAGQAWLRGESKLDPETEKDLRDWYRWLCNDLENILAGWKESRSLSEEEIANWRGIATQWSEDDYVDAYNRQILSEQRREPFYWRDSRFNAPTQPVVGVNWYEAMAYAAWLAQVTGQPYRLPTEAEWEWAARRNVRRFAWEGGWDPARCNSSESRLGQPSPVGVYPHGATPDGLHDLSGNVYEWTVTLYRPYRYDPIDGREDPLPEGLRVMRGGSWYVNRTNVRCAVRFGNDPRFGYGDLGYRVARSLA